jgi:hypothetical protein
LASLFFARGFLALAILASVLVCLKIVFVLNKTT